jgi:glyoxylate reductase
VNTRPKVFVTRELLPKGMDMLRESCDVTVGSTEGSLSRSELLQWVKGQDALVATLTERIDEEVMDANPHLKVISNYAVGYDNIDIAAATRRGIPVTNTPGVLTDATADMAWALLMNAARRVTEADQFTRAGKWSEWSPTLLLGKEVTGSTLGVVGFGRIGRAVARRAKGFDMKVVYYSRTRLAIAEEQEWGVSYRPLDALLQEADFVSLHAPLTDETRHLIGREQLRLMKPSAYLINTARGALVDERALTEALREKWIAGAGLDVFEREPHVTEELKRLDNVVLAPHLGSATWETRNEMARLAAENTLAVLRGERPPHLVNEEVWQ